MIFLTVGMERFSFDRMVKTVDEAVGKKIIDKEVFMQTGHTQYLPVNCRHRRFLSFHEMFDQILKSEIIVSHAGIGSLLMCLQNNKIPILFPRRKSYHEHLDDHQMDISHCIKRMSHSIVVYETDELIAAIRNYDRMFKQLHHYNKSSNQRQHLVRFLEQCAATVTA